MVDRKRGEEAFDLAPAVMVTGTIRTLFCTPDFYLQAGVNTARFRGGKWQAVARRAEENRGATGD